MQMLFADAGGALWWRLLRKGEMNMLAMNLAVWSAVMLPVLAALYITRFWMNAPKFQVLPKCAGSFVCLGTLGVGLYLSGKQPFAHLAFWALFLFMLGDFLIERRLELGGAAFAAGHLLLITWIVNQGFFTWWCVPVWLVAAGSLLAVFCRDRNRMGRLAGALGLYGAILTASFACAAVLPFIAGDWYWPFAAGLLCFVLSDAVLGKNELHKPSASKQWLLMALYYAALYLIAASFWSA